MDLKLLEKITNALLYEGYLLYPYRFSSIKNQQRFNFGVLVPQNKNLLKQQPKEKSTIQTECLLLTNQETLVTIKIRFLHLLSSELVNLAETDILLTPSQKKYSTQHQEAIEREINISSLVLNNLYNPYKTHFYFPANQQTERLNSLTHLPTTLINHNQKAIEGEVEIIAKPILENLHKLTVKVTNLTPIENDENNKNSTYNKTLMQSFVSVHTILSVQNGEFISLLEPPEEFSQIAASCSNIGTWPILIGENKEKNLMLSSPIILYDYPQIAPESPQDLYDLTEIDEILTLRIMTLTNEEKEEMRQTNKQAAKMLERVESLSLEELKKLHGATRSSTKEVNK